VVRNASIDANQKLRDHGKIGAYDDAMPKGDGWVGSWPIAGGTFGKTSLYVRQNDGGQLCNRAVVKDADYKFGQYHNNIWNANWFWVKDRNEQDVPVEVKIMSDLRGRVGAEHAVKILNWRVATVRQLYRLYLEVRWHKFTHARIMN
jgi:hypothetical protein